MQRIGAALLRLGHENVRTIEWLGAPDKGDAADFFQLKGAVRKFHVLQETAEPFEAAAQPTERLVLDRQDPMDAAFKFISRHYVLDGVRIIHFHQEQLLAWCGGAYSEIEDAKLRTLVYQFLDRALRVCMYRGVIPFQPNRRLVEELLSALKAQAYLPKENTAPMWLDGKGPIPAKEVIAVQNGILHLPSGRRFQHSPNLFIRNVLPVALPKKPGKAKEWERFLDSIFGKDVESRRTLQEIFGYFLTTDTRQQKIFLIVGPKRSGKGTIARVLIAILGKFNVCGPTLASLGTNFGMSTFLGKQLAIISDARLGKRTDQNLLAERLLSISGEDGIDIDRKYKNPLPSVRLSTRLLLLTNELFRIADASGAVASRFISIPLTESFYGREDHDLESRLLGELPEILGWAIEGWKRLHARGRFVQSSAAEELVRELEDLSSPVGAFFRDQCERVPGTRVQQEVLFNAWRRWAHKRGWDRTGTAQTFGRALRAVLPGLKTTRPRGDTGAQVLFYEGIRLKVETQ
jgi:putative DNA primase/helicase